MSESVFEAIIIGAGSTGSSIAFYLAKKGVSNVLLIDKGRIGQGMTGRSTGIVRLHYSNPSVMDMAVYSWRIIRNFQEEVYEEFKVFHQIGFAIGGGSEDIDEIKAVVKRQKSLGLNVKLLDPEEAKEIIPFLNSEGLEIIAYEPESGYADPVDTAVGYAKAAEDMGVKVLEDTLVERFKVEGNSIKEVITNRGSFRARYVINATGVWTLDLASKLNIKLPITLVRDDILVLERKGDIIGEHPVWADLKLGFYMRAEGKTKTLMGALDATDTKGIPPDRLGYTIPLETIDRYSKMVITRFPEFQHAKATGGWPGYYDITPDWQPIVGFDLKYENLIHCVGLSGHGFKLSPAFGDIVSDLIISGVSKRFNINVFNPLRFEKGISEESVYKYKIIG